MKRFREYVELTEGRYPMWVKVVVGGIVVKLRNLQTQIEVETDQKKQNILISRMNTLLGYISGLGIGVNSNDPKLLTKLRSLSRGKG